jgi:hypothetical protein
VLGVGATLGLTTYGAVLRVKIGYGDYFMVSHAGPELLNLGEPTLSALA